jgi:hypothetical protein
MKRESEKENKNSVPVLYLYIFYLFIEGKLNIHINRNIYIERRNTIYYIEKVWKLIYDNYTF